MRLSLRANADNTLTVRANGKVLTHIALDQPKAVVFDQVRYAIVCVGHYVSNPDLVEMLHRALENR